MPKRLASLNTLLALMVACSNSVAPTVSSGSPPAGAGGASIYSIDRHMSPWNGPDDVVAIGLEVANEGAPIEVHEVRPGIDEGLEVEFLGYCHSSYCIGAVQYAGESVQDTLDTITGTTPFELPAYPGEQQFRLTFVFNVNDPAAAAKGCLALHDIPW